MIAGVVLIFLQCSHRCASGGKSVAVMLNGRNLVVDTFSEVSTLLRPYATHEFWDFANHDLLPNSIYVLGRKQLVDSLDKVRFMAQDPRYTVIFCNAAEGSVTLLDQCSKVLHIDDLIRQQRIILISGGDLSPAYPAVVYEHLLCCILDYAHNIEQITRIEEIFSHAHKPYSFLFLNGRSRPHRKYLLERFRQLDLLDHSIYTYLDSRKSRSTAFSIKHEAQELMSTASEIRKLPAQYEVPRYRDNAIQSSQFVKFDIFNKEWGEIYLQAEPYIDTYFSVVTETVFEQPWSFRTEKIAKALAQGHPWICAASRGWYRDLRNLGFRTFNHILDESFDLIDDHQTRMERIVQLVRDLCQQNLPAFLAECESVCKYNQQHLIEFSAQHRQSFPDRFLQFIGNHARS